MNWKKTRFKNFKLYGVTDLKTGGREELALVEAAYRGGTDIIQLRSKALSDQQLYNFGLAVRALAQKHKKLFFVNDRIDLALALKADGVHLGQDDLPIAAARKMSRDAKIPLWVGKSTHEIRQAKEAVKEGADYIGAGPVFATPTKPGYRPAGLEYIQKVARSNFRVPFVAIGGIDSKNIHQVLDAGAKRVAVVRALFNTGDTYASAKQLCEQIDELR